MSQFVPWTLARLTHIERVPLKPLQPYVKTIPRALASSSSPSNIPFMEMIPDQIMKAIHFAEFVMTKEKKDRIGSSAPVVYPMKFFYFHDKQQITGLMGSPFHHPGLDDMDVLALAMRMFTRDDIATVINRMMLEEN